MYGTISSCHPVITRRLVGSMMNSGTTLPRMLNVVEIVMNQDKLAQDVHVMKPGGAAGAQFS